MKKACVVLLLFTIHYSLFTREASAQVKERVELMEDVNKVKDLTLDSLAKANQARPVSGSSRKGDNPVLFLVGNSTMRNGTLGNGNNGQWGWGYFEHLFWDENKITVENHALGGTSTRTFYRNLWPAVLKGIRKGDFVILELGHNDNGPLDSGRARASIKGTGNDSIEVTIQETGRKEWVYTFGGYVRKYVQEIRAKGATPILFTLTPRNDYEPSDPDRIQRKLDSFTPWIFMMGKELNVPVIDLNDISARKLEKFGKWKTNYFFFGDKIHSSEFGAKMNAASCAEGINESSDPQLAILKTFILQKMITPERCDQTRQKGKPVVFITGDSTVKNEDKDPDGMWGWGSVLETVFDPSKITLVNAGKAGRSARTFLDEGRWEKVYNSIQPGDFVVIQFGHNDFGPIDKAPGRGEIRNTSDSTKVFFMQTRKYEVVRSYGWYLRKFIDEVREKGATPILCSTTPRNEWPDGKMERRQEFINYMDEVQAQTGVDFVDIMKISADYYDSIGKEEAAKYFKNDHTHSSRLGAERNAMSFAEGLKAAKHPLAAYLK